MLSLRLLSSASILFICATTLNAEKPFDFDSTPGKLPKQVMPEEYSVRIKPDLEKLTFTGSEAVKLNVRQAVRRLVLNALEINITSASLDGKAIPQSALKLDPKQETLTITLASELPAGAHNLTLNFTGKINQRGQGLYYAPYQEKSGSARKIMLGTQFEATDARRFFPCWDEPSKKQKSQAARKFGSRPRHRWRVISMFFAQASWKRFPRS